MANLAKSIVVAFAACVAVAAQEATPVFRTTTDLVLVDAQVINKKTKTASGHLERGDFQIYEDGVLQEIQYIGRDELPLSVVLMFDLTDSVRPVLKRLGAGARAALAHLKPDDDVAVMDYAASARVLDDFTTDRDRTVAAIDRAANEKSNEAAFFNEAVFQAATQLQRSRNPAARRVVIWLTDNLPDVPADWVRDSFGKSVEKTALHTEVDAIRMLHESGTVVAPLILKDMRMIALYGIVSIAEGPWRHSHPPGDAKKYAELTGGQSAKLSGKGVDERLAELIDDLRSRYTLGYRPSQEKPAGTFCQLRVALAPGASVRAKEWNVLARAGYYRK